MQNWLYLLIAGIAGGAMAFQGTFNAALGKIIGLWESTFIVHIIGTITAIACLLLLRVGLGNYSKLATVPWYAYLGGVLNVLIIYGVAQSIPKIGVGNATTAIIVIQIITALVIDHLGAFGMEKYSFHYLDLLGVLLLAVGARILFIK